MFIAAFCSVIALSSCASYTQLGGASGVATGAAGGATAQDSNPQLERCEKPLGTLAIVEDTSAAWYRLLTGQFKLGSTIPVLRLIIQQSNCFVVVERGLGLESGVMKERELMQTGELRQESNFRKGQLVAADYTLIPSINFSEKGTKGGFGGIGGGVGGLIGGVLASLKINEASTVLVLVDNRSGVQVAAAEGSARTFDIGGLGGLFGSGFGGIAGGYANTPEDKTLTAAFLDAYNKLVKAVKNYKMQTRPGGLGTGGDLKVQESITPTPTQQNTGITTQQAPQKIRTKRQQRR
ncbi:MAG: CsgG/HfaB family protein [Sulfurihydrogenibium sp.]|nr:CsgG/HfaB family protein [Sulfurihydrogenibium sp.]